MDNTSERILFDQKHKLARRQFFVKTSVIAGAAALGLVGVGTALKTTYASGNGNVQRVPLYRLVKTEGNHFYTTSATERDDAVKHNGFSYEGVACFVFPQQVNSSIPLYRLVRAGTGFLDHLYTTSAKEKNDAISHNGFSYEGVACFVFPQQVNGSIPLYRLVKGSSTYLDHFYTTNAAERDDAVNHNGYKFEFVVGYVFSGQ